MLIFGLHSTSDDQLAWSMDSNPIHHPSPAKKNEMLIFGLLSISDDRPGWLMDLNAIHHPSPAKKNEMFIFGLNESCSDGLVQINRDSTEIFKFLSVLITAYHSLDSFRPAQKNKPCYEGLVQIG